MSKRLHRLTLPPVVVVETTTIPYAEPAAVGVSEQEAADLQMLVPKVFALLKTKLDAATHPAMQEIYADAIIEVIDASNMTELSAAIGKVNSAEQISWLLTAGRE